MNPVIEAAQRRTTIAALKAQLTAKRITPEEYERRMAEVMKGASNAAT
mgnify:CR=1 FL=1